MHKKIPDEKITVFAFSAPFMAQQIRNIALNFVDIYYLMMLINFSEVGLKLSIEFHYFLNLYINMFLHIKYQVSGIFSLHYLPSTSLSSATFCLLPSQSVRVG